MNYNTALVPPLGEVSGGNPVPITTYLTSSGSATITATTVGTSVVVPSTATGAIYLTGFLLSNGVTSGSFYMGYGVGVTAPTTSAIIIQNMYMGTNSTLPFCEIQPIRIPASNNLLITSVSATTMSITATYYIAP